METKIEDVCVVRGFCLTEYQIFDDLKLLKTYFNIRDSRGDVIGPSYEDISKPLNLMLCMGKVDINYMLSKDIGYITNRCTNAY